MGVSGNGEQPVGASKLAPTFVLCLQQADRIADDQAVLIELVVAVITAHGRVAFVHF